MNCDCLSHYCWSVIANFLSPLIPRSRVRLSTCCEFEFNRSSWKKEKYHWLSLAKIGRKGIKIIILLLWKRRTWKNEETNWFGCWCCHCCSFRFYRMFGSSCCCLFGVDVEVVANLFLVFSSLDVLWMFLFVFRLMMVKRVVLVDVWNYFVAYMKVV